MMVWAEIGKPNQREWVPGARSGYAGNDGLYPSGYYLFRAEASRPRSATEARGRPPRRHTPAKTPDLEGPPVEGLAAARLRCRYLVRGRRRRLLPRAAVRRPGEGAERAPRRVPRAETGPRERKLPACVWKKRRACCSWMPCAASMGDDAFLKLMDDYFAANTTKTVTAQSFLDKARRDVRVHRAGRWPRVPGQRHRPPARDRGDCLRHRARSRRQPLRRRADAIPLPRPVRKPGARSTRISK